MPGVNLKCLDYDLDNRWRSMINSKKSHAPLANCEFKVDSKLGKRLNFEFASKSDKKSESRISSDNKRNNMKDGLRSNQIYTAKYDELLKIRSAINGTKKRETKKK